MPQSLEDHRLHRGKALNQELANLLKLRSLNRPPIYRTVLILLLGQGKSQGLFMGQGKPLDLALQLHMFLLKEKVGRVALKDIGKLQGRDIASTGAPYRRVKLTRTGLQKRNLREGKARRKHPEFHRHRRSD